MALNPESVGVTGALSGGAIKRCFDFLIGHGGFKGIVVVEGDRAFERGRGDATGCRGRRGFFQDGDENAGLAERRGVVEPLNLAVIVNRFVTGQHGESPIGPYRPVMARVPGHKPRSRCRSNW